MRCQYPEQRFPDRDLGNCAVSILMLALVLAFERWMGLFNFSSVVVAVSAINGTYRPHAEINEFPCTALSRRRFLHTRHLRIGSVASRTCSTRSGYCEPHPGEHGTAALQT